MKIRFIGLILLTGVPLTLALASCTSQATELPTLTSAPALAITQAAPPLATAYAQEPAAGICASFEGSEVTVIINPDLPDPRCAKVRADQKLTVVNQTDTTLEISIGKFSTSLEPGARYIIETPFGEYLAPGVHQLQVSPCCGAELWLEGNP